MTLTLTLRRPPEVPLDADVLAPDRLAAAEDVAALPLWHGKERVRVGDFFAVSGSGDDVRLEGDLSRVNGIGAGISRLVRAIRNDERGVYTVSAPCSDIPEFLGISLSLPRILGSEGIIDTLRPSLTPEEQAAMQRSAQVIAAAAEQLAT